MASTRTERSAKAVALAQEFAHRFYNGETDWICSVLTPDFTWIGAQEGQYCFDADMFRETHVEICKAMPRCVMTQEEYRSVLQSKDTVVVAGQHLMYSDPMMSMAFASRQRVTFVWREVEGGELRLWHLHASDPLTASQPNEAFPVGYARETYRYAMVMANQKSYQNSSELRDVNGNVQMVRLSDVVYLEASRQSTVVYCLSKAFRVREGITRVAQVLSGQTGRGLVCVHRSYYVNALYVDTIRRDDILMTSGQTVPISTRRYAEACAAISRARGEADADDGRAD